MRKSERQRERGREGARARETTGKVYESKTRVGRALPTLLLSPTRPTLPRKHQLSSIPPPLHLQCELFVVPIFRSSNRFLLFFLFFYDFRAHDIERARQHENVKFTHLTK